MPGLFDEDYALGANASVVAREIIRLKEGEYPASALLANGGALSVIGRSCEQIAPPPPFCATTTQRFAPASRVSNFTSKPHLPA